MDLDLALLEDEPTTITNQSSDEEKSYQKACEWSSRLSLMFFQITVK